MTLEQFIDLSLAEDVGSGDHSALACIPADAVHSAKLLIKSDGILAGVAVAEMIFRRIDPEIKMTKFLDDGAVVQTGNIAFTVLGNTRHILTAERLVLNCMQRMSGIATLTNRYVKAVAHTNAKILDTRKTTPLFRYLQKWAVKIGGGYNHRFGLYDMIMIKDNHHDFCGGIKPAIERARQYVQDNNLSIKIEIEVRNIKELQEVLQVGKVDRIMLDNFSPQTMKTAVQLIDKQYETEASGGITLETISEYAETGVDYISVGALTHSYQSLDMSLKAYSGNL